MYHAKYILGAAGLLAAGVAGCLRSKGAFREACVKAGAYGIAIADRASRELQTVFDEMQELSVEAKAQARIETRVRERLEALEPQIREEVLKEAQTR